MKLRWRRHRLFVAWQCGSIAEDMGLEAIKRLGRSSMSGLRRVTLEYPGGGRCLVEVVVEMADDLVRVEEALAQAGLTAARSPREARIVVRIPIVPGYNDSQENLRATARFLVDAGLSEVNLLPFHRLAASKYAQLGLVYAHAETEPPTGVEMASHRQLFLDAGLDCHVGAETPY